jgi:[acyl-carrier-protein] S-malonyltransferase
MQPAAERVSAALADISPRPPAFPVFSNVTASPLEIDDIIAVLSVQVVSPVRFSETLEHIAGRGIETFVHIGPGDVTAGMAKRVVEGADVVVVNDLDSLVTVGGL